MDAVERAWPEVEEAFEAVLGPLTEVEVDRPSPEAITARYVTVDDIEVDVAVRQIDRQYEHICPKPRPETCDVWPGSGEYFEQLYQKDLGLTGGGVIFSRGHLWLALGRGFDNGPQVHEDLMGALKDTLPKLR